MAAEGRANDLGLQHGGEQRRPFAAGYRLLTRPRRAQAGEGIGQRFPGIACPQNFSRRNSLCSENRRVEQGVGRGTAFHQSGKVGCCVLEPVDQALHGAAVGRVAKLGSFDPGVDRCHTRRRLQSAQAFAIEAPRRIQQCRAVAAQGAEWMF